VPVSGATVNIPQGRPRYPTLEVNPTVVDITIATGATLTIPANQSLTVQGVLTNNGTVTVNSGGSLVQTVGSTLAGTGTYSVRRTINGPAGSRFIGSPINNRAVSGIGVTANGTNGAQVQPIISNCHPDSISSTSPYGNIMELREDATPIDNCAHSLWHVKSAGSFTNGRGYAVVANGGGQNLTFNGTVNNEPISYNNLGRQAGTIGLPYVAPAPQQTSTRGWHLVSNPFPSPINLKGSDLTAMGFDAQLQLWQTTGGSRGSWVSPDPLDPAGVDIAVAQGFQIRVASVGGSANFTLNNSYRIPGNPTFYKNGPRQQYLNVTLTTASDTDQTMVYFYPNATDNFDPELEANKLAGSWSVPYLYTIAEDQKMRYNAYDFLTPGATKSVPMGFHSATADNFTLTFKDVSTLNDVTVTLEDKKQNTFIPISEGSTYSFSKVMGDDNNRFVLHFNKAAIISGIKAADNSVSLFPNPTTGTLNLLLSENHGFNQINVYDVSGKVVLLSAVSETDRNKILDVSNLPSGIYHLKLVGLNTIIKRIVKQ
jgi:hypothetical protein